MTDPEFGLWVAHVANVLEDFHGAMDYDATADYAANLLRTYPDLLAMASQYQNGDAWPGVACGRGSDRSPDQHRLLRPLPPRPSGVPPADDADWEQKMARFTEGQ